MPPEDESMSLPEPPPPRSAARDAAIDAALRRFDGVAEERRPAVRRGGWNRSPAWGLAMAASLVAVIGLPAAFIALRDRGSPPMSVQEPAPSKPSRVPPPSFSPTIPTASAPAVRPVQVPPGAPSARLQRGDLEVPAPIASVAEERAAPTSEAYAAAPPPPPPPPPPAAPMATQKSVAESHDIAVTGARIPRPDTVAGTADSLNELPAAPKAADWVLKDRSYATFLSQLQTAIRTDDRNAVIGLIAFPLRVNYDDGPKTYRDGRAVRADFDRIFTPAVRKAILAQRFDRLFGRDQGIMIGSGEIWFDHVCPRGDCRRAGPVRIKSVNPL